MTPATRSPRPSRRPTRPAGCAASYRHHPRGGPGERDLGSLVTNDFLATLDTRNRQIVVLLNSGMTSRTEIAERLGYANHSAVSKRLAQIRKAAESYFDQC